MLPDALVPYAKTVYAVATTCVTLLTHWIATGEFNRTELAVGVQGVLLSLVVYFVSNGATVEQLSAEITPDDDGNTTLGTDVEGYYREDG